MLKLKKIGISVLFLMIILGFNLGYTEGGLNVPRDHAGYWSPGEVRNSDGKIDGEEIPTVDPMGNGRKVVDDIDEGIITLDQPGDYSTGLGYALTLIQIAINRTLGMLAFVALIFMLYNGFLVFSAGTNDKNVDSGKKGIRNAIIAIVGIALAWLIISAIIRIIGSFS